MKNILIPTDFSSNALNALNYALDLFAKEKCTFYLMNAFQLNYFTEHSLTLPDPTEPTYEQAKEISEFRLEKIVAEITMTDDNSNYRFEMISSFNSVLDAVKQMVDKKDISLIVMGTKGETNAATIFFGSNAENIMEKIQNCPVLVVPKDAVFQKETKMEIVFATDLQTSYKYLEFESLISIAKHIKAVVRFLHILENGKLNSEQENNKEKLMGNFNEVESTFHTLTNIKVSNGILSFIESRESNMLALLYKKRNFLNEIFSNSVVKEVGFKPKIPVYVIHELTN